MVFTGLKKLLGKGRSPPLRQEEVAELYTRYGALMKRRCLSLLRNEALADDAFQDAFINLIRYGAEYRQVENKLSWLYRVCDRACFRILDKQKRHQGPSLDSVPPTAAPAVPLEQRGEVLSLLQELSQQDRHIAVMAYVEGCSQGEIAHALGLSRQTINKRLKTIRQQAQERLGDTP